MSKTCRRLSKEFNKVIGHVSSPNIYKQNEVYDNSDSEIKGVKDFDLITNYMKHQSKLKSLIVPNNSGLSQCSSINYSKMKKAIKLIYPILKNKYRILHYSLNTDEIISPLGSEELVKNLGWKTTTKKEAWLSDDKLLGGYTESREGNLDLLTIQFTSHMNPQSIKQSVIVSLSNWILGKE